MEYKVNDTRLVASTFIPFVNQTTEISITQKSNRFTEKVFGYFFADLKSLG